MATEQAPEYVTFKGTFTTAQAWAEMENRGLDPLTPPEAQTLSGKYPGYVVIFMTAPEHGVVMALVCEQQYFEKEAASLRLDDERPIGPNMTFVGKKRPTA